MQIASARISQSLCHGVSRSKKAVYDLRVHIRVMAVLAALEGGVVVHLNNIRIAVIILYVHTIQAVADRVCRLDPEPDHVGGYGFSGTLSTPQYTIWPFTDAWILNVTDGIVYLQA